MDAAAPPFAVDPGEEFEFWGRQAVEHMLFAKLGLEDPLLKTEAGRQYDRLEMVYRSRDLGQFIPLLEAAMETKRAILARLNAGEWVGWLYPDFIDHVLREEAYFLARLRGGAPLGRSGEAVRWGRFMAEHAAFAAGLLDPTATAAINRARSLAGALGAATGACALACTTQLVSLSARKTEELNQFVEGMAPGNPRSVIHPVLREHVLREGRRGALILADAARCA